MRPFFSFLIVSDCTVYTDPKFLILDFWKDTINTIKYNRSKIRDVEVFDTKQKSKQTHFYQNHLPYRNCTDRNTLSYPTRRGNWATYIYEMKKWTWSFFSDFFLYTICKTMKMFPYIKKEIYIWIVEATDSIFSEWMRKLSWLWSFSIKTAHSVSTITFYMNVSICWHGNYLTSYALNFVVNTVVIQYCVYYEIQCIKR